MSDYRRIRILEGKVTDLELTTQFLAERLRKLEKKLKKPVSKPRAVKK